MRVCTLLRAIHQPHDQTLFECEGAMFLQGAFRFLLRFVLHRDSSVDEVQPNPGSINFLQEPL